MKCPECGKEMRAGFLFAKNVASLYLIIKMVSHAFNLPFSQQNKGKGEQ